VLLPTAPWTTGRGNELIARCSPPAGVVWIAGDEDCVDGSSRTSAADTNSRSNHAIVSASNPSGPRPRPARAAWITRSLARPTAACVQPGPKVRNSAAAANTSSASMSSSERTRVTVPSNPRSGRPRTHRPNTHTSPRPSGFSFSGGGSAILFSSSKLPRSGVPARPGLIGGDRINESDALGRFLAERSLLASSYRIRSSELYVAWATWCDQEGEQAGSNKAFTAAMLNKGYDNDRDRRGNWFLGCRAPCRNQP